MKVCVEKKYKLCLVEYADCGGDDGVLNDFLQMNYTNFSVVLDQQRQVYNFDHTLQKLLRHGSSGDI